jgi:hypothetical protein
MSADWHIATPIASAPWGSVSALESISALGSISSLGSVSALGIVLGYRKLSLSIIDNFTIFLVIKLLIISAKIIDNSR